MGIVTYASSKMNQKIGDGECVRLVEKALGEAGKKTTRDFGVAGHTADYVWGTLVASDTSMALEAVHPGDIVQFRNHVMTVNRTPSSGVGGSITKVGRPHHTAIITNKGVREDDFRRVYFQFSILEQNQDGKKYVVKNNVQFQKSDVDAGGENILIESTGHFWIYRPVDK